MKEENNKLKEEKIKLFETIEKMNCKISEIGKETKAKDSKKRNLISENNDNVFKF